MAHARIDLKDAVINGEDDPVNVVYSRAPLPGEIAVERFRFADAAISIYSAVLGIQAGIENIEERTQNFKLREEQERAIENTLAYYKSAKKDRKGKTPKFRLLGGIRKEERLKPRPD